MAKRKRLSPARPDLVDPPASGPPETPGGAEGAPGLETKAGFPGYPDGFTGDAQGWLTQPRRAPIASVAGEASASAALAEMAESLTEARRSGRMILELDLEEVVPDHLVRDRVASDEEEMQALMQSLLARGQQTPIEVTDLGGGRYGLISGWRRLQALRRLRAGERPGESGDDRDRSGERLGRDFGTVLALLRRPADAAEAYLSMVEENEIRVGLSYYERARIAARAVEQGVYPDRTAALRGLFHAASRPKRSKIGAFLPIVASLDGHLRHPAAMGERLGLALAKALDSDPDLAARLRMALDGLEDPTPEVEQRLLWGVLESGASESKQPGTEPVKEPPRALEEPRPGLRLREHADGSVTLSGPGLDSEMRARLRAWLSGD